MTSTTGWGPRTVALALALLATWPSLTRAQASEPKPPPREQRTPSLAEQIAELRARTAQLEAELARRQPQRPGPGMQPGTMGPPAGGMQPSSGGMPMGGMMKMMEMMMGGGGMAAAPGSAPAPPTNPGGMPMLDEMMARGMSRMGGPAGMQASALPGFPGQSHLYHIGATGFFVDHEAHIALSLEQRTRLHQLKQEALIAQADFERRISDAEQELWLLTGSDTPQLSRIEAKAREIEKLRADQRIAFIKAVGNAATVLDDSQRKVLTGMLPPPATPPSTSMPSSPAPQDGGSMPDM